MATNDEQANELFAVELAQLAREIAMDIFPIDQVLKLHQLTDAEWSRIQKNQKFIAMLDDMARQWNSALNTKERVKVKAATGLEAILEIYINEVRDLTIPLNQRVEAGKFLARLGELDGSVLAGAGAGGGGFAINITIGDTSRKVDVAPRPGIVIEGTAIPEGAGA